MGMYTEFHFNVKLKKETPGEVIEALQYMAGGNVQDWRPNIDHPLFKTERWDWMFNSNSYYFNMTPNSTFRWDEIAKRYYLSIRCNFKNYDDEIALFLDWITPHLDAEPGEFLGFSRYEEAREPTLIYYPGFVEEVEK